MLSIHKETTDNGATILKLEGDATIEHAEQLQQSLLEELRKSKHLLINCSQTTSIDFYAIQLLCSAHRTSVTWDKCLTFQGAPTEAVANTIKSVGFLRDHGCALCPEGVTCMWIGHNSSSEN